MNFGTQDIFNDFPRCLLGKSVRIKNLGKSWEGRTGRLVSWVEDTWFIVLVKAGKYPTELLVDSSKDFDIIPDKDLEDYYGIEIELIPYTGFCLLYEHRGVNGMIRGDWEYPIDWDRMTEKSRDSFIISLCAKSGLHKDARIIKLLLFEKRNGGKKMSEETKIKQPISFFKEAEKAKKGITVSANQIRYIVRKVYHKKRKKDDISIPQDLRGELYIGEFLMEEMGLLIGDHVDLLYSPDDGVCRIKRVVDDGFRLGKDSSYEGRGKISFKWSPSLPFSKTTLRIEAEIYRNPKEIWFEFPEETLNHKIRNIKDVLALEKEEAKKDEKV